MIRIVAISIITASMLASCSSNPDKYTSVYVSPHKYRDYTCEEIAVDVEGINKKLAATYEAAKFEHDKDVALTTAGVIIFPTLLFLDGDELDLERYGHLKGEAEALRAAAELKDCNIMMMPE